MKWKMLFRIGLTLVVVTAIILFYLNNLLQENNKDRLSKLVKSDNIAFQEALVPHGHGAEPEVKDSGGETGGNDDDAVKGDGRNHDHDTDRLMGNNVVNVEISNHEAAKARGEGDIHPAAVEADAVMEKDGEQGRQASNGDETQDVGLQPLHRMGKRVSQHVPQIHLAVVACGDRAEEVLVLLKSAVITTSSSPLVFHILAERELHTFFTQQLESWPQEVLDRVEFNVYDIVFPPGENAEDWRKLFKPCASQRLFLPSLLTGVDSLIYVDTDVLFLSPLQNIWAFFSRFNASQLVALAPETEDPNVGWYNRFARHPYVSPLGVNSGVMLMNLTRLRKSTWLSSVLNYYKEYRLKLTWGDQDLINIYFHFHPEELYLYTCEWNYRADHCMYMSICKPAEEHGAYVIHGSRRVMHNDKHPAFKAVYTAFQTYQFGQHLESVLLDNMRQKLEVTKSTPCGKVAHIFLKQMEQFVADMKMTV